VADAAGPFVAQCTPFSEDQHALLRDQVQGSIGAVFFVLAVLHVAKTLKQVANTVEQWVSSD